MASVMKYFQFSPQKIPKKHSELKNKPAKQKQATQGDNFELGLESSSRKYAFCLPFPEV